MPESHHKLDLSPRPFTWRGVRQILREALPSPVVHALRSAGITALFQRIARTGPLYETDVCTVIERFVQSGWVCADVGANIGIHTELMAKRVGEKGRVFAFEAHPENAKLLRKKFGMGRLASRVNVENVIVSDGSKESLPLYPGRHHSRDEWNIVGHDLDGRPTEAELTLPAVSLDRYFANGLKPDFVKIDVEGAETFVLSGMERLLRESRPLVLVEFHNQETWEKRSLLRDAGYELYDMEGRRLDPSRNIDRLYHVLSVPNQAAP